MYKITVDDQTFIGCNEDAWRTTSRIWFENGLDVNEFGACFTGSREVGYRRFAPQSGMNTKGLVFSRLAAYHPKQNVDLNGKKQIKDEVDYLSSILQQCRTIQEVKLFIQEYDHSIFINDVFIYIDKSGKYLIVEPYKLIEGNDPSYVLANFCPSITSNEEARNQARFKDGQDYLFNQKPAANLEYCRDVSETMHVHRKRNGDGTLLTSIWNPQEGLVNLYFYHDYETTRQFNIAEELAKGDYILEIPDLFPTNDDYNRLVEYKTPFNLPMLRIALVYLAGLFVILSFFFTYSFFRRRKEDRLNRLKLIYAAFNLLFIPYLAILATNIGIYYFDAPYQHPSSEWISLTSYFPFLMAILILPVTYFTYQFIKLNRQKLVIKGSLIINNIFFLMLASCFVYWGFYDVF